MISLDLGLWRSRSSGFNPLTLSPLAWWDWSDSTKLYTDSGLTTLVSADGDPLGGVKDKSGNNYHLLQSNGTQKGLYKTAIQNNKSVGRTDGIDDRWTVPSSTAIFKSLHYDGATIFFAGKAGATLSPGVNYAILGNSSSISNTGISFALEDRSGIMTKSARTLVSGSAASQVADAYSSASTYTNSFPGNTAIVLGVKIDPRNATPQNRLTTYKNSASGIQGNTFSTSAANTNSNWDLAVGSNQTTSGTISNPALADFYEVIIFASLLSDANISLVQNYLMSKWGVS